jgi:hypothetical protein
MAKENKVHTQDTPKYTSSDEGSDDELDYSDLFKGLCNTLSNPWTSGTYFWQLSRIIYRPHRPTRAFCAHFILTHAYPRKLPGWSPIPNFSKPSTLNMEVLSREASEKEDAPCWYGYSINSIKP